MSAELARVLAQAAGSADAPPTTYVVARYEPAPPNTTTRPYNVQPPTETYEEAVRQVEDLKVTDPNVEYGIFGPFHNDGNVRPLGQATVGELRVTPRVGDRSGDEFVIDGREFDALFYSLAAVDKFVIPYLVEEYGLEFAQYVRRTFAEAPLTLMGHLPWSEEFVVPQTGLPENAPGAGAGAQPDGETKYGPVFVRLAADYAMPRLTVKPPAAGQA